MSISTKYCKWCKGTGTYVGLTESSQCAECEPSVIVPGAQIIIKLTAADTDADWVSILAVATARMQDEISAGWMYKADQWRPEPRAIVGFSDLDKPVHVPKTWICD
jgi:hypothetical protein